MKKIVKTLVLFLAIALLVTAFSACTGSKSPSEDETSNDSTKEPVTQNVPKETTLKIFLFGTEGQHYRSVEPVIKEFENRTKNTLNIKLNITWTPPADYRQKLPMWVAAQEEMDLVFDAPWMNLERLASQGAYQDVEKYFNNDQYPGLKKAFSSDFINSNKFFGKMYAIPITNTFMDMEGVYYRKDLLDKYGLQPIKSYDDLYNFLTVIAENEPDYVPYGPYGTQGFFKLFLEPSERQLKGRVFTFLEYIDVAISADGKSVAGIAAYGDPDENYAGFPSGYGKEYVLNYFNNCRKFGKFLPPDVLAGGETGKDAAAWYGVISGFENTNAQLKTKYPDAELEFWPIYKNSQNMTPGGQATDYKAWNFLCVPITSKQVDRTMQFLDWVYGSQENNDLFVYGIEGTHWTAVGDNEWKVKEGVDPYTNYAWPGYQLGWSPVYQRIPAGLPDKIRELYLYQLKEDTFTETVLAGFTFNQQPVETEIAKCAPLIDKYIRPLQCGLFENPEEKLKEFNSELVAAGVDKIKEELKKQINEFLANKK